ncbi:MAG: sugar ABC transporter substrate-binding protein [Anaerolineales bacterium]
MKKSKIEKFVIGLLLVGLLLSGCAAPATEEAAPPEEPAPAEEQLFVGYSGPTQLDNFQIVLWEGMQERAEELGVKVVMLESDWDPVKQAADIEDLLTQDVDALIVNAADADGVIPSIEKANEQGVPVFSIDSAANGGEVLSHSGNDLYCIGYRSTEYLTEQLGGSGKVLHVNGVPGLMIVTWNDNGVNDFVAENPDIELVQQAYGEWDQAKAQAITEDVLTAHPDLAGVYIISESMTGGVVQALAAAGLTDTVKVMNGGYGPESQQWLTDGKTIATMEWASKEGAADLMQYVYDYVTTGAVPPTWSPWPVVRHTEDGDSTEVDCPIEGWTP